jgi:NTP pyrophosphatase (non-canonical NTP hydrolase)
VIHHLNEVKMLSQELRQRLLDFRNERDWSQFHNLRTLSTSIVLEAAELAEHTQWVRDADLDEVAKGRKPRIEQEVADIVILLTYLVTDLDIDVEKAVEEKLQVNAQKYPVERAKGSSRKYDELE